MSGPRLHARSRAVLLTLAALCGTALAAVWAAGLLDAYLDPDRRVRVVALAPLLAAAVIGTGLHSPSAELDATAVRPWWPRRLAHLLAPTALAALLLPLAVLGHPETFGAPAVVRNLLGCTGLVAASAVLLGARLSWLPATGYVFAAVLSTSGARGHWARLATWPVQAQAGSATWAVALTVFAVGAALYARHGARAGTLPD
ncbi:hypothetical protein KUM39_19370 [Streptomyces sp. J2-1]|nr:hypothetical protein [Streptomyces corallincola]